MRWILFAQVFISASVSLVLVACGGDDRMTVPDLGPPERVGHAKR